MMENCVFCKKIWNKNSDAKLVNKRPGTLRIFTFEPLNPVTPGHRLFVPQLHYARPEDYPYETGEVFTQASQWALENTNADYNLIVNVGWAASQTIRHMHVHFIPRHLNDGLTLPWTGQKNG